MKLEALHKVIKYCYVHGKVNKRMDKLISVLLKLMIRNKIFDRLTKLIKMLKRNSNMKQGSGMTKER